MPPWPPPPLPPPPLPILPIRWEAYFFIFIFGGGSVFQGSLELSRFRVAKPCGGWECIGPWVPFSLRRRQVLYSWQLHCVGPCLRLGNLYKDACIHICPDGPTALPSMVLLSPCQACREADAAPFSFLLSSLHPNKLSLYFEVKRSPIHYPLPTLTPLSWLRHLVSVQPASNFWKQGQEG